MSIVLNYNLNIKYFDFSVWEHNSYTNIVSAFIYIILIVEQLIWISL